MQENKRLISMKSFAEACGITYGEVRSAVCDAMIEPVRRDRRTGLYDVEDLVRAVNKYLQRLLFNLEVKVAETKTRIIRFDKIVRENTEVDWVGRED